MPDPLFFLFATIGELSVLTLLVPQALFLIPLTRFPGFVWLIAAGFVLPKSARQIDLQPRSV